MLIIIGSLLVDSYTLYFKKFIVGMAISGCNLAIPGTLSPHAALFYSRNTCHAYTVHVVESFYSHVFLFGWRLDCDDFFLKDRLCLKHLQCGPLLVINEFVTSPKCLVNG